MPGVVSGEKAHVELFFGGGRVQVQSATWLKTLPHLLGKASIHRNMFDDSVDNDRIIGFGRVMDEKILQPYITLQSTLVEMSLNVLIRVIHNRETSDMYSARSTVLNACP